MQDDQAEQTDEPVEATSEEGEGAADASAEDAGADAEATADDGGDDGASAEDAETAEAVDMSASPGGAGETVLAAPEVPDDANDKIAAAQEHINSLNMDEERKAAEQAAKNT
jgi:hypothetical protein